MEEKVRNSQNKGYNRYPLEVFYQLKHVPAIVDYDLSGPRGEDGLEVLARVRDKKEGETPYRPATPLETRMMSSHQNKEEVTTTEGRKDSMVEVRKPSLYISLFGTQVTEELPNGDLRIRRGAVEELLELLLSLVGDTQKDRADKIANAGIILSIEQQGGEDNREKQAHILFLPTKEDLQYYLRYCRE